jgi:hypothetical protein
LENFATGELLLFPRTGCALSADNSLAQPQKKRR